MRLLDIFGKKNDVKDIENSDEEVTKKQNSAQTSQYCDYIRANFARVFQLIAQLKQDTQELINQITAKKDAKLPFKEKGNLKKFKDQAKKNLRYLYLSRDFFTALSKNASGISLQSGELTLVTKFAPYFDGVPVLDVNDGAEESVFGAFKEVGRELRAAFISPPKPSSRFDFEDYLQRYAEKLDEFVVPNIDAAIESFKNATTMQSAPIYTQQSKKSICPCCGANLTSGILECEYCGASIN